ncbi:MAG: shikimate kinase [Acidimicrobiaceae bacterium]|nr:shikimate kinase [Acidimicrobiaceae bacterium]MYC41293.1 shikimate kinase [Acidimicrobiaceae bacterium]MYC43719.1 shikimate kinase [Acidimicrobiaceae bacterium]
MSLASVILVGPMGSGKTAVGRALAERERLDHVDVDEMIAQTRGLTIPEIFATEGESGFRTLEHEALSQAVAGQTAVISAGGGVVVSESNRDLLRQADALVVWLDAAVEVLAFRVGRGEGRPLLAGDDVTGALRTKVAERAEGYNEVADLRIDTSDRSVAECVELIVAARARNVEGAAQCR